jgi:hypothetical protein
MWLLMCYSAGMLLAVTAIAVVIAFGCGLLGAWVARQKGRSQDEGFWLGALLSLIGVLVEALLPAKGG